MTEQLDTSAAAIARLRASMRNGHSSTVDADYMIVALSAGRDAALARVKVLEAALEWAGKSDITPNEIREKWYPYGGGETL